MTDGMNPLEIVKAYIVENFLFGDDSRIGPRTDFLENGILDSTGVLELIGFLEEKFGDPGRGRRGGAGQHEQSREDFPLYFEKNRQDPTGVAFPNLCVASRASVCCD